MKNYEQFDWYVENKDFRNAAIEAASIASGKSSRALRSSWLAEVRKLRPDLDEEIRKADIYGDFAGLFCQLNKRQI